MRLKDHDVERGLAVPAFEHGDHLCGFEERARPAVHEAERDSVRVAALDVQEMKIHIAEAIDVDGGFELGEFIDFLLVCAPIEVVLLVVVEPFDIF